MYRYCVESVIISVLALALTLMWACNRTTPPAPMLCGKTGYKVYVSEYEVVSTDGKKRVIDTLNGGEYPMRTCKTFSGGE